MKNVLVKTHVLLLTLMVGLIASSSALAAATIVIQNNDQPGVGFNDPTPVAPVGGNNGTTLGQQRLNAFQFAANIWGATLNSGPPITVLASWEGLPCEATTGTLGTAGALSIRKDFLGAPFAATWYSVALANSISGSDLNFATAEIRARFNVNVGTPGCLENRSWYYGLDTNHGTTRINLVTVLLHELSHGLGFQTFTDEETGAQASGFASIYDRFLFDNTAGKTWVQMTNAERVASAVNSGNLVWNGPQVTGDAATVLSGGKDSLGRPRMFAPNPVESGSSISHWDTVAFPNQLMEPNINTNLSHSVTPPQDLTTSLMKDIGWPAVIGPPPPPTPTPSPPPNDNFANAQSISGCSGTVGGTNVAATREAGEPNHSPDNNGGSRSVWYQWQSPSNSNVTLTTAGSDYDTVLGVYTGTAVGSLTLIVKNDDVIPGSDVSSRVDFAANAGTIYRIAVDGYNNDNAGGDVGSITLNWSATSCSTASSVSFSTAAFSVSEGVDANGIGFEGTGFRTITVQRSGSLSVPATVDYSTTNGSAEARKDYAQAAGTLRFGQNESSKTFIVFITDDVFQESPESVNLLLSNPVGMTLGSIQSAVLTINSNDATTGVNPVKPASFNAQFFVRQHYLDFLNREPDLSGINHWVGQTTGCFNPNPRVCQVNVSAAFYLSIEFQETGYLAYRMFKAAFGDSTSQGVPGTVPVVRLQEFLPDTQRMGQGVMVGIGNWIQQLEDNKNAYAAEFVARQRFLTAFPLSLTPEQFVDQLNTNAGGALSQSERDNLVNALSLGTMTRAQVLRAVAEDQTLKDAEFRRAFVLMQYFGYLRRNADDAPDTNFGGWKFWLDKLNQFNGNFVDAEMVRAFLDSIEYFERFGP